MTSTTASVPPIQTLCFRSRLEPAPLEAEAFVSGARAPAAECAGGRVLLSDFARLGAMCRHFGNYVRMFALAARFSQSEGECGFGRRAVACVHLTLRSIEQSALGECSMPLEG